MSSVINPALAGNAAAPSSPIPAGHLVKSFGLVAAPLALVAIVLMPGLAGLPMAGQVMLGILAFAVLVWMTEALDYAVSAIVIAALMVFLLAFVPDAAKPAAGAMGTGAALALALTGFSNSAVALVAAACFIAAAMTVTGLDRRIALVVLSKVDAKTNHIVVGAMVVGFLLSFIVPSTTTRVACLVPIMMGFILAFKVDKRSRFAGLLVITAAQTASVWNVGIKTAAAQNMVAAGFIEKQFPDLDHLDRVVRRRGALLGAPERRGVLRHDPNDEARAQGNRTRPGDDPAAARRDRPHVDEGVEAFGDRARVGRLLVDRERPA